jgi:chorismate dehydratase
VLIRVISWTGSFRCEKKYPRKITRTNTNDTPRLSCAGSLDHLHSRFTNKERFTRISSSSDSPLRIAASSYLNSAPLIWSFLYGSRRGAADFTDPVPARCAQLLAQAAVDVALVPVIEYQRTDDVSLVSDVCVASRKEVHSVILISRDTELEDIKSVALDESSRTSATLVKLIFREFLGREPKWSTHSPNLADMLEQNDAALMIGDPAMVLSREGLKVWDMAQLWRNYTGLGFVFAMWMVRNDSIEKARTIDFAAARDEGVSHKSDIVAHYQKLLGLPSESLQHYLEDNISFNLDDELRRGLDLYFKLAHKHQLLNEVKPLKTIEP